jgi:hypothetical protein
MALCVLEGAAIGLCVVQFSHKVFLNPMKTRGVCQGLAIYIKKYLKKAKEEELWKLKYFTMPKYIIFQKSS